MTLAHEYDHVLQYGIAAEDVERDPWFAESSAVWMEDQVYNGINDYLRYVRRWAGTGKRTGMWKRPLTQGSMKEYGSAVWNEWLAHHYGRPIVREAWEDAAAAQTHRLRGRRLRRRRFAPPGARPSATNSPASPPTSPSGGPGPASARATCIPTCRGRGRWRSTGRRGPGA